MEDPIEAVIDLPFSGEDWTEKHSVRLQNAALSVRYCNRAIAMIDTMKTRADRNLYRLEVYEQVAKLVQFSGNAMLAMQFYDIASTEQEKKEAKEDPKIYELSQ